MYHHGLLYIACASYYYIFRSIGSRVSFLDFKEEQDIDSIFGST